MDFPSFTQNFTLTCCSTLTLNMILKENKNMIHFKQRLLPICLLHDLEIVAMNGGESASQFHTPLAVATFTGKQKKIKFSYFIATPRVCVCVCVYIYIYSVNFNHNTNFSWGKTKHGFSQGTVRGLWFFFPYDLPILEIINPKTFICIWYLCNRYQS